MGASSIPQRLAWATALLLLLIAPASARQAALGPQPAVGTFYCEEILEVPILLGPAAVDLRGVSLRIGFDPAVISPIQVLPGSAVDGAACGHYLDWLNPGPGETTVDVDLALLGCSINGGGEILVLRFAGVADGTSPLTVVSADLRNSVNASIPVDTIDASVDYLCPRPGTISFVPSSSELGCEETVAVDIWVDEYTLDLRGLSLQLSYDPAVVQPVTITARPLLTGAPCPWFLHWIDPDPPSGLIEVDGASLGCSVDGPGPWARITFTGINEGTTVLDCVQVLARDGENHPIPMSCEPATIHNRCAVGAPQLGWGPWKARYRD